MKAITRIILRRELRTAMWWSIGLGALTLIVVASYPSIAGDESIDELWQSYPQEVRDLFGGAESISELGGYLDSQMLAFLPLLFAFMGMSQAARALAGAEESGHLDIPFSTPLRREAWFMAQAIAIMVSQLLVAGVVAIALVLGVLIFNIDGELGRLLYAPFDALPAAWALSSATLLMSALSHRKRPAFGVGTFLALGLYFMAALAPLVDAADPLKHLSPFYYYAESRPLDGELSVPYYAIWLTFGWLAHALAWWRFRSKDLYT